MLNANPTPLDLAAIQARVDAATKGPWHPVWGGEPNMVGVSNFGEIREVCHTKRREDEFFIAHARQDIPALLAALATAEREKEQLREALRVQVAGEALEAHIRECAVCEELLKDLCRTGEQLLSDLVTLPSPLCTEAGGEET